MARTATEAIEAQPSDTSSAAEWTRSARRKLVSSVVQSTVFARSEQLSSLLTYVCEMTLKGRGEELNEQRIGHALSARTLIPFPPTMELYGRKQAGSVSGSVYTSAAKAPEK
ncbi:MAG: hypothetical protein ACRYGF_05905 [Janthinobacterium lividum]